MNDPRLDATAEALSELAELLDRHDVRSEPVRTFVETKRELPEFSVLAEETMRLQSLSRKPQQSISDSIAGPARPRRHFSAAMLSLSALLAVTGGLIYFAVRAEHRSQEVNSLKKQIDDLRDGTRAREQRTAHVSKSVRAAASIPMPTSSLPKIEFDLDKPLPPDESLQLSLPPVEGALATTEDGSGS